MYGDPVVVILVMIIGCAALIFGVLYFLGRAAGTIGRGFLAILGIGRSNVAESGLNGNDTVVCSNEKCRKIECRDARYCSQCGSPLGPEHRAAADGKL